MAIVAELLLLHATVIVVDPFGGRSDSSCSPPVQIVGRRKYGVVAFESIARLIAPGDRVRSLGYAERFRPCRALMT
jgi:hypothetical protein